ncbi:nucleotidyl transferase superfamily protein [Acanthamoeba castellanii str. Neff]|uniref:Nucleotidyl transferase superfamily protein n=1 Tax=Acanthamoeba castellanii (strain ATCC 30010 / Neff) TaxID=1257118 RepID=L8HBP2_ACACF|nr:nucleotidyl transferase superfamily protein [Acanthamoeba castellanii str. Neff]ELR22657.1 nucleotidyl transferase superfamily protein [Acanthamoeba castellanii str. Neff]
MEGKGVGAVVLAAGYGTRLERDLRQDTSGLALVPVGGKPLLDYWMEAFERSGVAPVYVVCNTRHEEHFKRWAEGRAFPLDHIINDGSTCNEERKGAIGALHLAMKMKDLSGDLLAVAGDTLFDTDFKLEEVIDHFKSLAAGESLITYYEIKDRQEVTKRGIIEVDENDKAMIMLLYYHDQNIVESNTVTKFLEKPKVEETESSKACPPLYIYSKSAVPLINQYVDEAEGKLALVDAPVAWLSARTTIRAHRLPGRFDIGSLGDYIQADAYFQKVNSTGPSQ